MKDQKRDIDASLQRALEHALRYIHGLEERDVVHPVTRKELLDALDGELPEGPSDPAQVIDRLAAAVEPGIVASTSGRFFGFVEGGVVPASLAADWLTSTWDQNPGFYALSPAAAVAEEVAGRWLLELLGLPLEASVGFTTGAQLANVAGLAAARHHVLAKEGWDAEAQGLQGAPSVTIVAGEERHVTVARALRFLGFGERTTLIVPADDQGRMDADEFRAAIENVEGPLIVCAQAGNVNTGSCDPLREIAEAAHERGGWVHVDGAFGLWAAASPRLRGLVDGVELCDSWATDGHKWLNVPYDSGFVFCAHPESHRTALAVRAPYLIQHGDEARNGSDWTPESSRRARVFAVWAAIQSLGRSGVAEMVETCCDHARLFAESLREQEGFVVLNDVELNQVLVRVDDDDDRTRQTARAVQADGSAWFGDTVWQGRVAIRISVSDQATTKEDVQRAVRALVDAAR